MELLWLGDAGCDDPARVGGKVANLSRLAGTYPVPEGFCVPVTALDAALLDTLPAPLRARLADAYQRLAERSGEAAPRVAVRSSAADEDGDAASFAGQHETYLNITGGEAVAEAVVRCLASAHNERARSYRRQHGLTLDGVRIAVFVQRLVPADVSAVVFSANPVTGDRGEIVINASWGLGESIVGGTVTPDTFVVRKRDHALRSRLIAEKRRMTVSVPGGTREVDVPRLLRSQPALNDAQLDAMAALASALEQTMGWPIDIECALHGDRLALLQCRPITTLMPDLGAAPAPALAAR